MGRAGCGTEGWGHLLPSRSIRASWVKGHVPQIVDRVALDTRPHEWSRELLVKGEEKAVRPVGWSLKTAFKRKEGEGNRSGREDSLLCQPTGFLFTLKQDTKTLLNGAVKDKCDHKELPLHTH